MNRSDVSFYSQGTRCAAWLYRPDGTGPHPCIILAHGFGATRDMLLDVYAERFVKTDALGQSLELQWRAASTA